MFSRDIARRLVRLEADRGGQGIRYVVSDRLPTDEEWEASQDKGTFARDEVDVVAPLVTEAQWVARYCAL